MFIGNLKLAGEEKRITINTAQITWFQEIDLEWEVGGVKTELVGITEVHLSDGTDHALEMDCDDFSSLEGVVHDATQFEQTTHGPAMRVVIHQ